MKALSLEISNGSLVVLASSSRRTIIKKEATSRPPVQPVVKWAGGKQWLSVAAPLLSPKKWEGIYYEPFLGGGSFFFALEPGRATLSDCNSELIAAYHVIRDDPEGLIRLLGSYPYDGDFYYSMRERSPHTARARAARLLYLNRTCWNGLYRLNKQGKFNTPFGGFTNPTICNRDRIRAAAKLLRRVRLRVGDFADVVSEAQQGDFVYFDPPYITRHQNNSFLKYNAHLFSWSDQERLAQCAIKLASQGVSVLVSNADNPSVINLYRGLFYYRATRHSLIGGPIASRGVITEALLSSYPLLGCTSEVI